MVRKNWTGADFFGWLKEHQPGHAPAVGQFVGEAKRRGLQVANGTAKSPSIILGLAVGEVTLWAISLFTTGQYALKLQFRLERFDDKHIDARAAAELLAQPPGQRLDLAALAATNYRKWIFVGFDDLTHPHIRTRIVEALDTARAAPPSGGDTQAGERGVSG